MHYTNILSITVTVFNNFNLGYEKINSLNNLLAILKINYLLIIIKILLSINVIYLCMIKISKCFIVTFNCTKKKIVTTFYQFIINKLLNIFFNFFYILKLFSRNKQMTYNIDII